MITSCEIHPDHPAIEQCEVCHKPLCGLCLWYEEAGRRLCADHAREATAAGATVFAPDQYAEAIGGTLDPHHQTTGKLDKGKIYAGNQYDVGAFITAILGVVTLASCGGGLYCFPFLALGLAIYAYSNAHLSVNPARTRQMASVGLIMGGILIGLFILWIGFMLFGIFMAILSSP